MRHHVVVGPAHIDQIRSAYDGRLVLISADVGGVAADLQRLDKGLEVRFGEHANPPCWIVEHRNHPGCPHNMAGTSDDDPRNVYLVTSRRAWQNRSGTWEGLTPELVHDLEAKIPGGRGGYDLAKELDRGNRERERNRRHEFAERTGETAERMAHALRKDMGERYRGRAFITRKP